MQVAAANPGHVGALGVGADVKQPVGRHHCLQSLPADGNATLVGHAQRPDRGACAKASRLSLFERLSSMIEDRAGEALSARTCMKFGA
jgi:hypothetical protein